MQQLSLLEKFDKTDYKLDHLVDVSNVKPNKQYNSIELFAGAGGLALGLHNSGFHNIASIELDKNATKTLRSNMPEWNVIEEDVNIVADKGISSFINLDKEVDLISGGVPCQSFSYAGKSLGFADTRGTLFHPMSLIIKEVKPKLFLLENVKGLVSHDKGKTIKVMLDTFSEIGYEVYWKVLNAWDYNTAQKRERLFMVGIRNDLHAKESYSYGYPEAQNYKPVLRDILIDVPESDGRTYPEEKYNVMKLVPPGGSWVDLPDDIARSYMKKSYFLSGGKRGMARRMSWDEPSLTLTTSPDMKQTERCHPEETRPFTVREYARIQGFPDEWQFEGSLSSQYKQIGNAVPVELGRFVGLSLINYLNQFNEDINEIQL